MSFTRWVLRNRHGALALMGALILGGLQAYRTLPIQLFPDTAPPMVTVITPWPGASAVEVADGFLPLEEAFAALEGIAAVNSTALDDLSIISLEFAYDRDPVLSALDAQSAVGRVRGRLPRGILEPQILRFSMADRPVVTFGVKGGERSSLRRLATDVLAPRLQQVPGVAAVDVYGGAVPAVLVELDRRTIEALGLSFARVVELVSKQNTTLPAGRLRSERRQDVLRVESRSLDLSQLARLPLVLPDGSRVLLGDVAKIHLGSLDDDALFSVNGKRAIALQITRAHDANAVDVVERVRAEVELMALDWPELQFFEGDEDASFTSLVVGSLLENIWQALALASLLVFFFLGRARPAFVAAISMPLSYALTFVLMKALGLELNMVSLSAVILAVGMVVDASVVVIENIIRHRIEFKRSAVEAAVQGTDEVRLPVLAGAGTTLIVLVPLVFLDGFVGRTFGPLALTLVLAFSSSVFIALVLVPLLTVLMPALDGRLERYAAIVATPVIRATELLGKLLTAVLSRALGQRWLVVLLALASLLAGLGVMRSRGMEVLPRMDGGSFFISLETPSGTSLAGTSKVLREIEEILERQPEIVKFQSQAGFEAGMRPPPGSVAQGPTQGFITVTLSPRTQRLASVWEVQERVRGELDLLPGLSRVSVRELGNTAKSTTAAPVLVRLSGADPLVLDRLGDELVELLAEVEGVVDPMRSWRRDQRRTVVKVDTLRAASHGLTPADVAILMRGGADGLLAGDFVDGEGSPLPIWLRFAPGPSYSADDLLAFPIPAPPFAPSLPLRSVARLEESVGQGIVTRENLLSTLEVSAFTSGRSLSFILSEVDEKVGKLLLPRGYEAQITGERRDLDEAKSKLGGTLIIALIAVYFLLVAQLRSWLQPATILLTVPLSISGVAIALWLGDKPASMPVMVGLILLVGIVVNNAIILIDFVERAREAGKERREALIESVVVRLRPILMTSLSTVVGMIPLAAEWALGAERFSPLALAVIGGLTTSTFLTLIVIPVFYDLFDDIVGWFRRLFRRPASAAALIFLLFTPVVARAEPIRLDLKSSLELARANSLDLLDASDEVAAADYRVKEARGRMMPALEVQARYSRMTYVEPRELSLPMQPMPAEGPSGGQTPVEASPPTLQIGEAIDSYTGIRVSLDQPLFAGGSLVQGLRAAKEGRELAQARWRQREADLELEVSESYFSYFQAIAAREVATRSLALIESYQERLLTLLEAGRATPLDLYKMDNRLARARLALEQAKGAEGSARLRFAQLLGLGDAEVILTEELDLKMYLFPENASTGSALSGPANPGVQNSDPVGWMDATARTDGPAGTEAGDVRKRDSRAQNFGGQGAEAEFLLQEDELSDASSSGNARLLPLMSSSPPSGEFEAGHQRSYLSTRPSQRLGNIPELDIAWNMAKLHKTQVKAAQGALWPRLALRLGAVYENPNQRYFPMRQEFDGSWDASLVLSWTPWDFGQRWFSIQALKSQARIAERSLEHAQRKQTLAVERLQFSLLAARQRIELAQSIVRAAKEAEGNARILFDAGRLDATELLASEAEYANGYLELIQAVIAYRVETARLERWTGLRTGSLENL